MTINPERTDWSAIDPPDRVVSLSASNTEILYALGQGHRLVGVSEYCDYPAEASLLPRVGTFITADINGIKKLKPDLVLTSSHLQKAIVDELVENDIGVLALNPTSMEQAFRDILIIGKMVGQMSKALQLVVGLQSRVENVMAAGAGLPIHPRVYIEEWGKPIIPAGWWLADFITLAGGVNALPQTDTKKHSKERVITAESVASADPEIIIVSWPGVRKDSPQKKVLGRPEWREVSAIKNGRVYWVDDRLLHRPGPRMVTGLEEIHRVIASCVQQDKGSKND